MIKTFDEFVLDMEIQKQEELDEGKIKNITMAVSLASTLMFGINYVDNKLKELGDNNNTEVVHNSKQIETEKENLKKIEDNIKQEKEEKSDEKIVYDNENYYPSEAILDFIKSSEGWHQGWKNDGKGFLTTGWGFKITRQLKKQYPKGMTKAQADKYFKDVAIPERVKQFKNSVPNINYYSPRQLDALFDLFYNIGYGKFTNGSPNLQKALESMDSAKIVQEMNHDYDNKKLPGIKIRRDFERDLFMQDVKA